MAGRYAEAGHDRMAIAVVHPPPQAHPQTEFVAPGSGILLTESGHLQGTI